MTRYNILEFPQRVSVLPTDFVYVGNATEKNGRVSIAQLATFIGGGGGAVAWGGIGGTLSAQTDLQNALNLKANSASLGNVSTLTYPASGTNYLKSTGSFAQVAYAEISGTPTLGTVAALSYPGGTTTFLRADGTFATPGGSGDFVGPASSTSGNVVSFNGTTGKLGQDSGIAAANVPTMAANAAATGRVLTSAGTNKTVQDSGTLLTALATLASPTFTGTPAAPTATAGTNTTQLATTAFVTTADNLKAPLASPTFTGTPAAPTAAVATSTTQLATTAFVQAAKDPTVQSVTSSATVTPTFLNDAVKITAQAAALALANPTGTARDMWGLVIRIKDNGTARAISYDTQYRAIGVSLPATTVISKTLYLALIYNAEDTKWDVLSVGQEA